MIPYFDRFVDTTAKRYHALLIVLMAVGVGMLVSYLIVGYQLVQLQSYDDLFALLKTPYTNWTYISRIIVDAISIRTITFSNISACLINNLSAVEVIAFLLSICCFGILEKKRATTVVLLLLVVEVFGSCGFALHALQSSTLANAIQDIRNIGILMLCMNSLLLLIFLYYGIRQLRYYHDALQYEVEEIKEHMVE